MHGRQEAQARARRMGQQTFDEITAALRNAGLDESFEEPAAPTARLSDDGAEIIYRMRRTEDGPPRQIVLVMSSHEPPRWRAEIHDADGAVIAKSAPDERTEEPFRADLSDALASLGDEQND